MWVDLLHQVVENLKHSLSLGCKFGFEVFGDSSAALGLRCSFIIAMK